MLIRFSHLLALLKAAVLIAAVSFLIQLAYAQIVAPTSDEIPLASESEEIQSADEAETPVEQVQAPSDETPVVQAQAPSDEQSRTEEGDVAGQSDDLLNRVADNLTEHLPGIEFSSLTESVIPGLFEVITQGQIYYISESAQYLIDGNLIRLEDRTNLTESKLGSIQIGLVNALDEEDMLIYEPEIPSNRSITVFTDISCGFCRRLHAELDTLLENGVRVRYLLFPRAGLGSQGHKDLESVWCAEDPLEAMTVAKAGGEIIPATCGNPIESHVDLAQQIGLRGTPLIFTDSGEKIPGYREATVLSAMVNDSEPVTN